MLECCLSPVTGVGQEFVEIEVEVVWQKSTECVCVLRNVLEFVVPVKSSACGHASGKALDSQLSEVGDSREIGSHDGQ